MEIFCEDLRNLAMKIINYEKKGMIPLTNEEKECYEKQKVRNCKVRDHCHYSGKFRGVTHNSCNLRCRIPKENPIVFNNVSTYNYHFIIKN